MGAGGVKSRYLVDINNRCWMISIKDNNPPEVTLFEAQEAPIILPSISSFPLDLITAQTHPSLPLQLFMLICSP